MEKPSFIEKMASRDRERKMANEKNQKARQQKSELEGVDYFDSIFDTKIKEIDMRLNEIEPTGDSVKIQEEFVAITKDLQELQRYFTSSTLFLNDHKIQSCQNKINRLVTKTDETKARIVPKKKFGFRNKTTPQEPKTESKVDGVQAPAPRKEFLWTFYQRQNEFIEISGERANNQDLTLKEIEKCVVVIKGHPGSVQVSHLKNCLVLCGPVSRSFFADFCTNCTFVLTCQQLRLHSSTNCDIYIQVTSRAIIEDCKEIRFAPSNYTYEGRDEDLNESGLDGSVNNWEDVGDFNWLSADKQSPNWSRIEGNQMIEDWASFTEDFKKRFEIP